MSYIQTLDPGYMSLRDKIRRLPWELFAFIAAIGLIGVTALYSAGGGSWHPWAFQHLVRFAVFLSGVIIMSLIHPRFWHWIAYPFYGLCLAMLVAVDIMGVIGMGAQRWINLGFIQIQPSELTKVALVLALARFYSHRASEDVRHFSSLLFPALLIAAPVGLVMFQPDLGTGTVLMAAGVAIIFLAGAPMWWFGAAAGAGLAALPVLWSVLHEYQRNRILTFLNPESDPLGAGYHITQSKIALGSGGITGKGFLNGTQSHLDFLPEKQTDFVFTLWAEEWGLLGTMALLALVFAILMRIFSIARLSRTQFSRLMVMGLGINFCLYIIINTAMVMGLIPVVGVPFPLMSHGGTAMMAVMLGFGFITSIAVHRDAKLPRG
jgi:rod shape determining protein RodA